MERPSVPMIRRATAAPGPTGRDRLRRCTIATASIAVAFALAPVVAHAAPTSPAPDAAPTDPTASTTTTPTTAPSTAPTGDSSDAAAVPPTSGPGFAVPGATDAATTSTAPIPTAPTPVTADVLADVATGAPPVVPQLASRGASAATGAARPDRPARAELPVTGGSGGGTGLLAVSLAGLGGALVGAARRPGRRVHAV